MKKPASKIVAPFIAAIILGGATVAVCGLLFGLARIAWRWALGL